jgi:hypothetical protein
VKRNILLIALGIVIGGGAVGLVSHMHGSRPTGESSAAEKPADEESDAVTITHDADDNVVIHMSDETQGDVGIVVTNLAAINLAAEVRAYGRVLDPVQLAAAFGEFTAAQAANENSQAELQRLKTLAAQNNASARALQAAEAAAARDQVQFESARLKWVATGCSTMSQRPDFSALMKSLDSLESALVRVDLLAGEKLPSPPVGARLTTLSGDQVAAGFLGAAPMVDPQTQSRGFLFLVQTNAAAFAPGAAVTALVQISGEAVNGTVVPRDAVVRTGGKGWVYVLNAGGEAFTRKEIALDHATETGWFVRAGAAAGEFVVVSGAQTLLSQEMKASLQAD